MIGFYFMALNSIVLRFIKSIQVADINLIHQSAPWISFLLKIFFKKGKIF